MSDALPFFLYHPDPIGTGSIVVSDEVCECCGKARGYKYNRTPYCEDEIEVICPWCIADGSAHSRFDAEFTAKDGIGGYGFKGALSDAIAEVVAYRTPGFAGWQQERWWVCCNDAAAFLGPAGKPELDGFGAEALEAIKTETGLDGEEWDDYHAALDKEYGPTAYIFQCRHCHKLGGYSDCH